MAVQEPSDAALAAVEPPIMAAAQALGYEIVRIRFFGGARLVLQIMAEKPDGTMNVSDCAALSREISAHLDVADPIPGQYSLEVSSPGIDRPLTRTKDFERWQGFEAKIELHTPTETGRKRFRGVLGGFDPATENIAVTDNGQVFHLPFKHLRSASLVLTDALLKAVDQGKALHGLTADDVEIPSRHFGDEQ